MLRGRRIAFDYGDVRIGVATCDSDAILVSPFGVVRNNSKTIEADLSSIIREIDPIIIYCGWPNHLSGAPGASVNKVEGFIELIGSISSVPIVRVDERLSTVTAQARLRESGVSARDSKNLIDAMAAVTILEQGLASEKI
jgi:putative holliday junction resolvase